MRQKVATDLTAQYIYCDVKTLQESVSEFKYLGLEETEL